MARTTIETVNTKVEVVNTKVDAIHSRLDDICKYRIEPIEQEAEKNTDFRNRASGAIAIIAAIGAFVGGFAMWIMNKVWK